MEQTQPESMQTLVVCELGHTGSNVLCVGRGRKERKRRRSAIAIHRDRKSVV